LVFLGSWALKAKEHGSETAVMNRRTGLRNGDAATLLPAEECPAVTRILVTDNHPEMFRLMARALGDSFECEFASGVGEAHEKLSAGTFQLAICNLDVGQRRLSTPHGQMVAQLSIDCR
jgi:hypothetical protein